MLTFAFSSTLNVHPSLASIFISFISSFTKSLIENSSSSNFCFPDLSILAKPSNVLIKVSNLKITLKIFD